MKAHWLCLVLLCGGASLMRGQQYLEYRSIQTVPDNGLAWKRGYIEGYTPTPSVSSGATVGFMVSTLEGFNPLDPTHPTTQTCSIAFYRVRDHLRTLNI